MSLQGGLVIEAGGKLEFVRVSPVTLFNPILVMRAKAANRIRK
jgi:hypothetical protein